MDLGWPIFWKKNLGSFLSARCGEGYGNGKRTFFWRRYIFELLFFHSHVNFRGCMYNYIMWVCLIWTDFMLQEKRPWFLIPRKKSHASPQVSWAEDYLASTSLEGKVQLLKRQARRRCWTDLEISETFPKFVDPSNAKHWQCLFVFGCFKGDVRMNLVQAMYCGCSRRSKGHFWRKGWQKNTFSTFLGWRSQCKNKCQLFFVYRF